MVIWLIGMSGSGKTTLGRALYTHLKKDIRHLVYLDGDEFREMFRNDVDHTVGGRRKNAERVSPTCRMLDIQGIHVLTSVLSIFPDWQAWNRENFSAYYEIFLDVPLETLKKRDVKGLYAGAESGAIPNVVGVDIPFPRPMAPDLVITESMQRDGVEACVAHILKHLPTIE